MSITDSKSQVQQQQKSLKYADFEGLCTWMIGVLSIYNFIWLFRLLLENYQYIQKQLVGFGSKLHDNTNDWHYLLHQQHKEHSIVGHTLFPKSKSDWKYQKVEILKFKSTRMSKYSKLDVEVMLEQNSSFEWVCYIC